MTPVPLINMYYEFLNNTKLLAAWTHKHLSDKKFTVMLSKSEVKLPPTDPVIQDFIRLSSASEALYLTCKNGLLIFVPKIWSYTVDVPAGIALETAGDFIGLESQEQQILGADQIVTEDANPRNLQLEQGTDYFATETTFIDDQDDQRIREELSFVPKSLKEGIKAHMNEARIANNLNPI